MTATVWIEEREAGDKLNERSKSFIYSYTSKQTHARVTIVTHASPWQQYKLTHVLL